jgi:hypothetical protein
MHSTSQFKTADVFRNDRLRTGNQTLDILLDGGLETGMMYLFYGDPLLHDDLHRLAVQAQLPPKRGGLGSSCLIIDSANMLRRNILMDCSYELGLEPEDVNDRIFISRAFNSSQTYDLVINQLDDFIDEVSPRLVLLPGFPDLYTKEGLDPEMMQQLTHLAIYVMIFTMKHNIITVVSAKPSEFKSTVPSGGKALASSSQVHILVHQSPMRIIYELMKHPSLPHRRESRAKTTGRFGTTLPLEFFIKEWQAEE